jgi:V8-like Glu-specific endopeptidase
MTRRNWVKEFRAAASTFDWPAVNELASEYTAHLYAVPALLDSVTPVLQILRQALRYEELELVADAALAHGLDVPAVRRQYAQALVDGRNPALALRLYTDLAADEATPKVDRVEARGGIGRCYKELFLACAEPTRRRHYLTRSLDAYLAAYRENPKDTWHGINAVALLARAGRDGIGLTPESQGPAELAEAILRTVDLAPVQDAWTEVTACEAAIALGRYDDAIERAEAFIETRPDGFTVATFLRQLQNVWQLDTTDSPGNELLPVLRSALLGVNGGQVTVESADVRAARLDDDFGGERLERVLGTERYQSLTWYRTGLQRCRSVARVQTLNEDGIGTAFLLAGPDLHPDLPPLVVVTNGHVVPEALDSTDALLAFHGLDDDPGRQGRFRVARQWWYQPSASSGLDTAILELDGYPQGLMPTPLAKVLPRKPLRDRRAYVIGHPRGLAQPQFSLQDNMLLDYDERVLHYRSPTEPGSSGSPVFNNDWQLIGLHHAGGAKMARLKNAGGTYAANEGITFDAIRGSLAAHPPDGRGRR